MVQDIHFCPRCHAEMFYRLGEFTCPGCQYTEPLGGHKPVEPEERPADSIKRARLLAPPGGTVKGSGAAALSGLPPTELYTGPPLQESGDKLKLEKIIYITAITVINVISLIVMSGAAGVMSGMAGMQFYAPSIGVSIVMTVFGLCFQGLALFTNAVWLKWTLLVLSVLALLGALAGLVGSFLMGPGMHGSNVTIVRLGAAASVGLVFWCLSLVYRDIQLTVEEG